MISKKEMRSFLLLHQDHLNERELGMVWRINEGYTSEPQFKYLLGLYRRVRKKAERTELELRIARDSDG